MRAQVTLALLLLLGTGTARAEPVFTGKVSLGGLYYTESDGKSNDEDKLASNGQLGYAELRALVEGKRLWRDRLDLKLDLRLRFTSGFDFENKFTNGGNATPGTSARGYLGGSEYEIRQLYGVLRISERTSLQVGRMFVQEADALKIDGVRLAQRFGPSWEGAAFLGGYPNPYSRSLMTDYTPTCGAGVAAATVSSAGLVSGDACQAAGPQLGLALGMTARYSYDTLWGALGLVGSVFGGSGDGGPVMLRTGPAAGTAKADASYLNPPLDELDAPRIYLSWINSWRPLQRLDVFANLVLDLYGGGGPQLTRLVTLGTLRLLKDDRLTLRLGYSRLSSLAINMYLNHQLYSRLAGGTPKDMLGIVENNLTVLRTARDEVRATADFKVLRRLGAYLDARVRFRGLLGAEGNPFVYQTANYNDNKQDLAWDLTLGLRDSGSIKDIRALLSYTALQNFRALNHVITLGLGRDFWKERVTLDFDYVLAKTDDSGAGATKDCNSSNFALGCFGQRSGMTHELGLLATVNPWHKLFFLFDYRFTAMLTDPIQKTDVPTVLSHSVLLRGEFRW